MSETCPRCEKPMKLCVCDALAPDNARIESKIALLILRHPQEQDKKLGSARLAVLQLKDATLKTGLSWSNLSKAAGREADPKRWGVLYLGTAKTSEPLPPRTLTVVNKKNNPFDDQDEILKNIEGIILLDGTWAQAKALWWRNAWLLKCRRLVLQPPKPSLYGNLRKEPRKESVSTIEAAAYTIAELEGDDKIADKILEPFHALLKKARGQRL